MNILLKRIAKKETYTIGKLYIDNVYFCDTIEDKDRGLNQNMSINDIKKKISDLNHFGNTGTPNEKFEQYIVSRASSDDHDFAKIIKLKNLE